MFESIIEFLSKYGTGISQIFLIFVGTLVLIVYLLQERTKRIEAASLIVLQIDELEVTLRELTSYLSDHSINNTAFYESLPLMEENYWEKYKHYFVRDIDASSYATLNQFYMYVSEIQEQQVLIKSLQRNHFFIVQNTILNMESQIIASDLKAYHADTFPQDFAVLTGNIPSVVTQGSATHDIRFQDLYSQQKSYIENALVTQNNLTMYIPEQIYSSLDKILRKKSMLTVVGTDGYQLLKKLSSKKAWDIAGYKKTK